MNITLSGNVINFEPPQRLLWLSISSSSWSLRIVPADSVQATETALTEQIDERQGGSVASDLRQRIIEMRNELLNCFPPLSRIDLEAIPNGFEMKVDLGEGTSFHFQSGERYVLSGLGATPWERTVTAD